MRFYPTIPRVDSDCCGHVVAVAANLESFIAAGPVEWSLRCLWFVAQWGSGLRNCSVVDDADHHPMDHRDFRAVSEQQGELKQTTDRLVKGFVCPLGDSVNWGVAISVSAECDHRDPVGKSSVAVF